MEHVNSLMIHGIEAGILFTNAWIVADAHSRRAVVIDAPRGCADEVAAFVQRYGYTIDRVLLTHSHWDHTGDADELRRMFGVTVAVHPNDEHRLQHPHADIIAPPFPLEPMNADAYLAHNDVITVGALNIRVLFTPGHTEGSVCFFCESEGVLLSGDTLFAGSIGRTDLPGGSWSDIITSLNTHLTVLPPHVRVYPGHGPSTTIGHEVQHNPFLNGEISG